MTAGISPVRYAEADAKGMREALQELGYEVDCVLLESSGDQEHRRASSF
ncbi:hypothetical protein [Tunturiibacter lichenicola]